MAVTLAEILVYGQKVVLVERKCRGCKKKFRVFKKSKQKFHSQVCELFTVGGKVKPLVDKGGE